MMSAAPSVSLAAPSTLESFQWSIVNDTVMGGRSSAQASFDKNKHLQWTGNLSLENNGGFVSIRSEYLNLDWSQFDGVEVVLEGAGRDIQVSLQRRDRMIRAGGYRAHRARALLLPGAQDGRRRSLRPAALGGCVAPHSAARPS